MSLENIQWIDSGAVGNVYRAYDADRACEVAIKEITDISKARNEAEVMRRYGEHPVLPRIYDYLEEGNTAYIIMEFVGGQKIEDGCSCLSELTNKPQAALRVTYRLLEGVKHLHDFNYSHNDILAKNVMIMDLDPNKLKLVDFDCAAPLSEPVSREIWNYSYKRKDLYDTAMLCINMLHGLFLERERVGEFLESLETPLRFVLEKGVHPDPVRQYATAEEFMNALAPLI